MKKYYFILVFLLVAFIVSVLMIARRPPDIKNINSSGKNIVCFGNSLTYGYGADKGFDYPSLLRSMVNFPVINAGRNGDTTYDALKRLESDVIAKEPFLVIVEFGGNDFLKHIPKNETIANIEKMVKRIQDAGAMVVLVETRAGLLKDEYLKDYQRIAKQYRVLFIPNILKGILTNPRLKYDYIHPNSQGYEIMAKRIFKKINFILKNRIPQPQF